MRRVVNNMSGLVLLLAFVLSVVGSVPGFAWCIGADGHIKVEYVAAGGCGDDASELPDAASIRVDADHCGPCLDVSLQTPESSVVNRLHHKLAKSPNTLALKSFPSFASLSAIQVAGHLVPKSPPRISQAILEHSKIVLMI